MKTVRSMEKYSRIGVNARGRNVQTLLGLVSILLWSTAVAFSRSMTEKIGSLNTAFFILLFSGIFLFFVQLLIYKKEFFQKIKKIPFTYLYKVGIFLVLYMVFFHLAIGEAASREAVIVVGIINYLWPGFVFLFSVPILKEKAKYSLLLSGTLVAFAGIATAFFEGNQLSLFEVKSIFSGSILPFLFALAAALSWGIYSNMTRKYKFTGDMTVMPALFVATAVVVLILQLLKGEIPRLALSSHQYFELAYIIVFPTATAYLSWDMAMKRGNKNFLVAVSYGIPLMSTLISGLYLKVKIGFGFVTAAVLVIIGAILCRLSIIEKKEI